MWFSHQFQKNHPLEHGDHKIRTGDPLFHKKSGKRSPPTSNNSGWRPCVAGFPSILDKSTLENGYHKNRIGDHLLSTNNREEAPLKPQINRGEVPIAFEILKYSFQFYHLTSQMGFPFTNRKLHLGGGALYPNRPSRDTGTDQYQWPHHHPAAGLNRYVENNFKF